MSTTKIIFAANSGLSWVSGEPTPFHSYASIQLLDNRPHNEQLKAYYLCDSGQDLPLNLIYNELNRTVQVSEIQSSSCGGNYDPKTDDILFYRQTTSEYSYITFTDGAKLTAATLNLDNDQLLHLIQEITDRLEETNPYWNVFPDFTCALTASLQCDVTSLLSRVTQEELNVDNLQLWAGGGSTNDSTLPQKWSYNTDEGILLTDGTTSGTNYSVSSLFDHSRALHHYTRGLRDDVNWLLGQQGSLDGATITGVASAFPVDSLGEEWNEVLDSGCKHVKHTFTLSNNKTYDVVHTIGPYVKTVTSVDSGATATLNFTFCDGTIQSVHHTKLAGPTGAQGAVGATGGKGDGFWTWRRGALGSLGTEQPNYNVLGSGFNNVCYAVDTDNTFETNPNKGDAGHIFEKLSPTFGGPGINTGSGDYTGYLLRLEQRPNDTQRYWYCTDCQFPVGADASGVPIKYFWNSSAASPTETPIAGQFQVDTPANMATVTSIKMNDLDATGNDVSALLSHLFSGSHVDPEIGLGTLILSKESTPGICSTFKIMGLTEDYATIGAGPGFEISVVNLTTSSAAPFNEYIVDGNAVSWDRVTFHFSKHGQVPATPAVWSSAALSSVAISADENWFGTLTRIPDVWKSMTIKNLNITFSKEIAGSSTVTPKFEGKLYRVVPERIKEYICNGDGSTSDWSVGSISSELFDLGSVKSVVSNSGDSRFTFDSIPSDLAGEQVLPGGNANGYLFMRCVSAPFSIDQNWSATLQIQAEGNNA